MNDGEQKQDSSGDEKNTAEYRKQYTVKDKWDKWKVVLNPIGGLFTGLAIALVGFLGSNLISQKQSDEVNLRLYSELMSKREESENKLRSDMFQKIFDSFLARPKAGEEDKRTDEQKIDDKLLSLSLLTRNFHEAIDIRPLFLHILFEILEGREKAIPKIRGDQKCAERRKERRLFYFSENDQPSKACREIIKLDIQFDDLLNTARRITRKQIEILKEVGEHIDMIVPLKEMCDDISPRQPLDMSTCKKEGVTYIKTLILGEEDAREFKVTIKRAYPWWKEVRVIVDAERDDTVPGYERYDKVGNEHKEFWVGYFDFPMVDNTYLSDSERYSVSLEKMDNDTMAKLTLVYFPAAYAGLKEKSFYHQKALNHLERASFLEEIEKNSE